MKTITRAVLTLITTLAFAAGSAFAQQAPPVDLGDLIKLYRDANGVPILTPTVIVTDPETGADIDGGLCQQPIALPSDTCPTTCVVSAVDEDGTLVTDVGVVDVDQATCAVLVECATCTEEVDFGRTNDARSSDAVFASQLDDVIVNLATADCVTLDPAGRLVTSTVADDGTVSTSAIDSPLQNLAIYRQLMLVGFLGAETSPIVLPAGMLDTAARGLGAASDKSGEVNVDLVAYLNKIMGLDVVPTFLPKICIDVREEVQGVVQLVQKCFLNYGPDELGPDYGYSRTDNFSELPSPAYIPAENPLDGWFEYLAVTNADPLTFEIVQGPILDAVFGTALGFLDGNIGGFAQAADDARAVIDFMHTWPVPSDFATPVTCGESGATGYDVSISPESGLQVPTRIVDGSEGREFTVTVANAGPDAATGIVTVTAVEANGSSIATFPRIFTFANLAAGTSQSWTELFSIDLGRATTINWTATVVAEFDVNPNNNSVTATSTVKLTGGGGGGRP